MDLRDAGLQASDLWLYRGLENSLGAGVPVSHECLLIPALPLAWGKELWQDGALAGLSGWSGQLPEDVRDED